MGADHQGGGGFRRLSRRESVLGGDDLFAWSCAQCGSAKLTIFVQCSLEVPS